MSRKSLPVIENVDDLMKLATKTTSCQTCKHVLERHRPNFMKCGAHGGRHTSTVNPRGTCVQWEPEGVSRRVKTSPKKQTSLATQGIYILLVFGALVVVATLLALVIAMFQALGAPTDTRCRDYAQSPPTGPLADADCDHPDHEIEVRDDMLLCRCRREQTP